MRAEFLEALGDWLLNLPERNDHDQRLLPYVLSFHGDELESISARAVEIMEAIGAQHEKDRSASEAGYKESKCARGPGSNAQTSRLSIPPRQLFLVGGSLFPRAPPLA